MTLQYLFKFVGAFCLLYFGTKAFIGLTIPGGYYFPFLQNHLDYISLLRKSLLLGTRNFLSFFGYHCNIEKVFYLRMLMGKSVHIVYSCLGYGIISFWIAFIFANHGSFTRKCIWIVGGIITIWGINVLRIAMLLLAINNKWNLFFGLNHHTWFNIITYIFIFIGIYFYDRSNKNYQSIHDQT